MQLVIQLLDLLISYLFWKAKTGVIVFLNYLFLRLNHFCCQAMHSTFYLVPLFYVSCFIFMGFFCNCCGWDKNPFVFRMEKRPGLNHNICLSQSYFFEIFVLLTFPRKSRRKLIENIFPPIPLILIRLEVSVTDLHTVSSSVLFSLNPIVLAEANQP